MKKTLTVNLSGTVFHIDEDAYCLLDNYLDSLKLYFRSQKDGHEIVCDIENRISELFSEKIMAGQQVITIADAEVVIQQMGNPEEFDTVGDDSTNDEPIADTTTNYILNKRLFRDPDNKILGGVCSGLAAYLGWDVTLVRIIAILILIFGYGLIIPIYIVCWIIIPEARTVTEKLSMHGEEINVETIGKKVTDGFEKAAQGMNDFVNSDKPRTWFQKFADVLVAVFGVILKVALILLAVIFGPVLLLLAFVLLMLLVGAFVMAIGGGAFVLSMIPFSEYIPMIYAPSFWSIMICVGTILFIAIPFGGLV